MRTTIETISSGRHSHERDRLIARVKATLERLPDTTDKIVLQATIYHDPRRSDARLCVVGCPIGSPEHEITVGQQQILTPRVLNGKHLADDFLRELRKEAERAAQYLAQYHVKTGAQAAA